jgi:OmpA-OmpF porin, OOP family
LANPNVRQPLAPAAQQPAAPGAVAAPGAPALQQRPGAPAPVAANAPVDPKALPQHLDELRNERQQVQVGNQTVIREANRTIIQEGGRQIIRHDEADRFRFNAREVNVERHGNDTVTVVLRPDGARIITEVDENGRLLRRVRRDAAGREVVLIDSGFEPRGPGFAGFFVNLPAPVVRIPRELYIREAARATADDIYLTLMAPPVDRIERRYGLDEILYSEPLRARMPRVDVDSINFSTGSWEITPDQSDRLAFVAQGIMRSIQRNPQEMFLVEGYTDAVGNDVDNLSLSDRRAESVAVMLTNQFGVPAENLTTQGYGKQFLKVPTDAAERANRRVAVRRITPLLAGGQS